jgi:serine/threonine-protein kinase RsbW
MQVTNSYDLQIINDFSELRHMSAWLYASAESMALPEKVAMHLDLCANEAVTNIISYAYKDRNRHQIQMRIALIDNRIVCLNIEDDGMPFNPFDTQPPAPFDNIENAKIGGLGIHFMRSLMDECHYRRSDGKNIVTLSANIKLITARTLPTCGA